MSTDVLLPGAVVDGKYRIESLLGRGGMGAVYRAVHAGTDRTVALKVIAGHFAGDQEYVERFRREARACGRLRHPGIVDVTDFGVATHGGHPLPYLVMEFLDGRTLADHLRDQPRPPLPWVIDVLEQVCAAVEEAHRHGILHRDLKPENVWLEPDRRGGVNVKVLDFGLAKLDTGDKEEERTGGKETLTGITGGKEGKEPKELKEPKRLKQLDDLSATFMSQTMAATLASPSGSASSTGVAGTPAYMSPEQSRGEMATARSDVYSIGVMAYRMITGQLPFEGSLEEVITAKQRHEAPSLRSIRIDVHADAANLVSLALSKDPERRPASAGVFGNMLAGQLEPVGAFFTRALVLFISRLSMFLKIGFVGSLPFIIASVVAAAWQLIALTGALPWLGGRVAIAVLFVLFLAGSAAQLLVGCMPLFVVHALATPSRAIDLRALIQSNRRRLRLWLAGVTPFMAGMLAVIIVMLLLTLGLRLFGPAIRSLPRPARVPFLLVALMAPFAVGYALLRRRGLGIREAGMIGPIILVEDKPAAEAGLRSAALMKESGGLRNAVQKWYLAIVAIVSGLLGMMLGASGATGRLAGAFILWMPLVAIAGAVFLTVNAIIGSLIYVSARRSKGESLDQIYGDVIRERG